MAQESIDQNNLRISFDVNTDSNGDTSVTWSIAAIDKETYTVEVISGSLEGGSIVRPVLKPPGS